MANVTVSNLAEFWSTFNPDCSTPDELRAFALAILNTAREIAAYADNKAVAMECRLRGDIPAALVYEKICDDIYARLPEFARW